MGWAGRRPAGPLPSRPVNRHLQARLSLSPRPPLSPRLRQRLFLSLPLRFCLCSSLSLSLCLSLCLCVGARVLIPFKALSCACCVCVCVCPWACVSMFMSWYVSPLPLFLSPPPTPSHPPA